MNSSYENSEMLYNSLRTIGDKRHSIHLRSIVNLLNATLKVEGNNNTNYLEHIYDEFVTLIAKKCYLTKCDHGRVLFTQGRPYGAVHILFDGIAHEKSINPDDNSIIIDRNIQVGSVIGADVATSNMKEYPSTVSIISKNGAMCCSIPRSLFVSVIGLGIFNDNNKNNIKNSIHTGRAIREETRFFLKFHDVDKYCYTSQSCVFESLVPEDKKMTKNSSRDLQELELLKQWVLGTTDITAKQAIPKAITTNALNNDLIDSSRKLIFEYRSVIFKQNVPRRYLYIISKGEATFYRTVHNNNNNSSSSSNNNSSKEMEIDIGLRLFPGDFIMLDGEEGEKWLEISRLEVDGREPINSNDDIPTIAEMRARRIQIRNDQSNRKRRKTLFETHKHHLIANTYVEVIVLPLEMIAKCEPLFSTLLQISTKRYPALLTKDESLIQGRNELVTWNENKTQIIQHVEAERFDAKLNEGSYNYNAKNNLTESMYDMKLKYKHYENYNDKTTTTTSSSSSSGSKDNNHKRN